MQEILGFLTRSVKISRCIRASQSNRPGNTRFLDVVNLVGTRPGMMFCPAVMTSTSWRAERSRQRSRVLWVARRRRPGGRWGAWTAVRSRPRERRLARAVCEAASGSGLAARAGGLPPARADPRGDDRARRRARLRRGEGTRARRLGGCLRAHLLRALRRQGRLLPAHVWADRAAFKNRKRSAPRRRTVTTGASNCGWRSAPRRRGSRASRGRRAWRWWRRSPLGPLRSSRCAARRRTTRR